MTHSSPWHIGIIIPARNEEKLLPRCLSSVLRAKAALPDSASVDVVVVADSSEDQTVRLAAEILQSNGVVRSIDAGVVGIARRVAAQVALERCSSAMNRCWLANTDADCVVPSSWLTEQLTLAQSGIEAVAGIVTVDNFDEHGPEVGMRFKTSYIIESDGSHPHVHGANLGVRADAYLRAGGWRNLKTAEDHDLWHRLSALGSRQLSTSRLVVQTSGRRVGRAPSGFANALAAHNETAA